ncbi:hypothetical protein [Leptospira santarosai]|uniref:hypothetical protein n=1 Tax=Leptospira santarosai TaxID=28183 RepID=UPI0024AFE92C|nr:hypothetical protein [Leptospira santarosai]MDI7165363.1 hypothetical protein [Leptospira santarosai]
MSFFNSTNRNVMEPILYKKEQEALKESDTFFVRDKEGELMYMNRYDAIRILDRLRTIQYQNSEVENGR